MLAAYDGDGMLSKDSDDETLTRKSKWVALRPKFPLDRLAEEASFNGDETDCIQLAYKIWWVNHSYCVDDPLLIPSSCIGTKAELWWLLDYVLDMDLESLWYSQMFLQNYARLWGIHYLSSLFLEFISSRRKLQPTLASILMKISTKPPTTKYDGLCPEEDILANVRGCSGDFPFSSPNLAYVGLSPDQKLAVEILYVKMYLVQYMVGVESMSPRPEGTPMELWFMLKKSGDLKYETRNCSFLSQRNAACKGVEFMLILGNAFPSADHPGDPNLIWTEDVEGDILKDQINGHAYAAFSKKNETTTEKIVYHADWCDLNIEVKISRSVASLVSENVGCARLTKTQMRYFHTVVLSVARLMGPDTGAYTRGLKVYRKDKASPIPVVYNKDTGIDSLESSGDALSNTKRELKQKLATNKSLYLIYQICDGEKCIKIEFTFENLETIQIKMTLPEKPTLSMFNRPVTIRELVVFGAAVGNMAGFKPDNDFECYRPSNFDRNMISWSFFESRK